MKKIGYFGLVAMLVLGCKRDKIDFDMLDDLSFNPEFQVPVVNARLSLNDIVEDDSTIIADPNDNSLSIAFYEDSLFEFAALDFINIPDQEPTRFSLEKTTAPFFAINVGLGTLGGVQLSSATFEKGFLKYTLNAGNAPNNAVDFRLRLTNATLGGNVFDQLLTLPAGTGIYTDSIDISGLNFDFSNGGTTFNYLGVFLGLDDTSQATGGEIYNVDVAFSGLSINTANGFFGNRVVPIPDGSFDLDFAGLEEFTSGLLLTNPRIKLISTSNVGMTLEIGARFNGVSTENVVQPLGFQPQNIQGATTPGTTVTSEILVDRDNSSIVEFLANLPEQILYSGSVLLNPGQSSALNFIDKDARVKMGMEIDIPLEFSAQNMALEQVIEDVQLVSADNEDLIESVTLFFRNKNGFPFELDLNVSFLDSLTGDSINGVHIPILNPAPTDAQGRVTQRLERNFNIKFEEDQVADLARMNAIRLRAVLNTPNGGTDEVKLFSDYSLQTLISVRTKLNVEL